MHSDDPYNCVAYAENIWNILLTNSLYNELPTYESSVSYLVLIDLASSINWWP
jgi:hypothetical protein